MPTAHISYLGDLRTLTTHLQSGTAINTDAPTDNQGKGEAFSPTDLTATSLAACMITTMGIVAQRDNVSLVGTEIDVTKIMSTSGPRRIARIEILMHVPAGEMTHEYKQKMLHTANACPVAASLHPDIEQYLEIHWV